MRSIIMKESKIRVRSWKAPAMIMFYVSLLAFAVIIILNNTIYDTYSVLRNNYIMMYSTIAVIQVCMISLIVPVITSGSISMEREKQTLDLLLCTNLKPINIILGKLLTSISQVLLLIIASLPIFSFVLLFGGLDVMSIVQMNLFYIVLSFFFGALGVFFSTVFKKTMVAIVMTYIVILFLVIGTFIIALLYINYVQQFNQSIYYTEHTFWVLYFNPAVTFASVLFSQIGSSEILSFVGGNENFWLISNGIFVGLSVILTLLSGYFLNPVRRRFRAKS